MAGPIPLVMPGSALLPQDIPLALGLMVISSLLFAGGAAFQHFVVGKTVDLTAENRSMNWRQICGLLTNVRWLVGLALAALGASLHILALMLAPVTVVQPVGILAVPWSVLLAARIHRFRPTSQMWGAVALTVAGIVVFTLISSSTAAPESQLPFGGIVAGCLTVVVCGSVLGYLGKTGSTAWRCIMWASGGSCFYGLSSALIKVLSELVGIPGFYAEPLLWTAVGFMALAYLAGGWMIQQGYANGPASIVVGAMTTADPIVAVGFGLAVPGEGVRLGPVDAVGMALASVVAVGGVVILSRRHPDQASVDG